MGKCQVFMVRHPQDLLRGWSFPVGAEVFTNILAGVLYGAPSLAGSPTPSRCLARVRRWPVQPFPDTAPKAEPRCRVLLQAEQKCLLWEERQPRVRRWS